ncbi:hypothetical protein SSPIM334S_00963 [Streptomyces spiroverticillatus]
MNTPDAQGLTATPLTSALVRGALDLERTAHGLLPHRLPAAARAQIPDGQLTMAEAQPSGVRLAFRTRATVVELDTLRTKNAYKGAPERPDGFYDLVVDGRLADRASTTGGNTFLVDLSTGSAETIPGPVGTVRFDGLADTEKDVEIWLPYNEITQLVALRTDEPVAPVQGGRTVWLHHGSSISHGSDAESPSTTWPALAASLGGVELINLGFGGSALLDPFTARAMRDTPADLISVKIGINLVNTDAMRLRALGPAVHGFLDTIREGHPTTPLLVVSPSCARSTRTHRGRARRTSPRGACGSGRRAIRRRSRRAGSRSPSSAPNSPGSSGSVRLPTRTCTTSTAARCTARGTTPSSPSRTSSTRTRPRIAASPNASGPTLSPRAAPSPPSNLRGPVPSDLQGALSPVTSGAAPPSP